MVVTDRAGWAVDAHAGFGRRVLAMVIDGVVVGVITSALTSGAVVSLAWLPDPLTFALPEALGWVALQGVVWLAYDTVMHAWKGFTLGKSALKIQVRAADGARLSLGRSFVRSLVKFTVSSWVFYLGWLWAAWDPDKQAWHDKLVRSYVVSSRNVSVRAMSSAADASS